MIESGLGFLFWGTNLGRDSKYAVLCVSMEIFRIVHHAKLHPLVLHEKTNKQLNRFQFYKKI